MEDQLTVRLPRDLSRAVKSTARRIERRPSEVVKMALRAFLEVRPAPTGRPADRVRALLGSLESGILDLADKHRAYVLESLNDARLKTASRRTHVVVASEVISAIDAAVGRRGRSRFILQHVGVRPSLYTMASCSLAPSRGRRFREPSGRLRRRRGSGGASPSLSRARGGSCRALRPSGLRRGKGGALGGRPGTEGAGRTGGPGRRGRGSRARL